MRRSRLFFPFLVAGLLALLLVAGILSAFTVYEGSEDTSALDPRVVEFAESLGIEVGDRLPSLPSRVSEIVTSYDTNKNGIIDISELFDAIDDYFDGEIFISDLFSIIDLYFSGEQVGSGTPTAGSRQISDMIARVRPAIVKVVRPSGAQGSGVIFKLDADYAYLLTNQHVTKYEQTVSVTVENTAEYTGTVLGVDVGRDLAVVRIDCPRCSHIGFGDSTTLNLGDDVVALGYPLDRYLPRAVDAEGNRIIVPGSITVTKGIVSAFRYDTENDRRLVQTDTPINPGNSGGPLLSLDGEIMGINTFSIVGPGSENVNFAILETTVQEQLSTLLAGTDTPKAPTDPAEGYWSTILGSVSGHLHHDADNRFEYVRWNIGVKDLSVSALFENPYAHSTEREFSYGFTLRGRAGEPFLVFAVTSLGDWALIEQDESDIRTIASGGFADLRVGDGQFNHLSVVAIGNYVGMSINGELLVSDDGRSVFDIGDRTGPGFVAAVTGYYANSEVAGEITHFQDLYVSAFHGFDVEAAMERLGEVEGGWQATHTERLDPDGIEAEEKRTP